MTGILIRHVTPGHCLAEQLSAMSAVYVAESLVSDFSEENLHSCLMLCLCCLMLFQKFFCHYKQILEARLAMLTFY